MTTVANGKRGPTTSQKPTTETPKPEDSPNKQLVILKDQAAPTNTRMVAFESILQSNMQKISACIPEGCGLTGQRMMRLVLGSFRENPKLLNCTTESIFLSINEAATLGFQLDGTLGHAYLIPYGEECTLLPGYKGLIDLARRKDKINIKTRCVYKGDEFRFEEGDDDFIKHVPNQSPEAKRIDSEVSHVYLVARDLSTGNVICRNVWSRAMIEDHKKKYSKAHHKKDNPWNTAWSSMARKTLIRDSIARGEIPVSVDVQRLANREEQYEAKFIEAPEPRRQSIDGLADHLEANGGRSTVSVPDDFELPTGEAREERNQSQGQESGNEQESETAQQGEEFHRQDLLIRDGESPKKWEFRIIDEIRNSVTKEEMQDVADAIVEMENTDSISGELAKRLSAEWDKKMKQIDD